MLSGGAYHGTFSVNGTPVVYANAGNDTNRPCFGNVVGSPNDATADADVSTLSHELFESITDPLLGAWRSNYGNGEEIGDLCAYQYGPAGSTGDGQTFSSLWINNNGNVTFDGPQITCTPLRPDLHHPQDHCALLRRCRHSGSGTGAGQSLTGTVVGFA